MSDTFKVYEIGEEWPLERTTEGRTVLRRFTGATKVRVAGYAGINSIEDIERGWGEYELELLDDDDNLVGKRCQSPHRMQANIEDNGHYTIIVPDGGDDE